MTSTSTKSAPNRYLRWDLLEVGRLTDDKLELTESYMMMSGIHRIWKYSYH